MQKCVTAFVAETDKYSSFQDYCIIVSNLLTSLGVISVPYNMLGLEKTNIICLEVFHLVTLLVKVFKCFFVPFPTILNRTKAPGFIFSMLANVAGLPLPPLHTDLCHESQVRNQN